MDLKTGFHKGKKGNLPNSQKQWSLFNIFGFEFKIIHYHILKVIPIILDVSHHIFTIWWEVMVSAGFWDNGLQRAVH